MKCFIGMPVPQPGGDGSVQGYLLQDAPSYENLDGSSMLVFYRDCGEKIV